VAYPPGTTPKTREDVDTVRLYNNAAGTSYLAPRQLFNRLEACAYLGISPRTLLRLRKEGKITGYSGLADPAGGRLRYRRADLDALLELKPAPHPDAPIEGQMTIEEALTVPPAPYTVPAEYTETGDRDRTGFEPGEWETLHGEMERAFQAKRPVVFGVADFCPVCPDGGGQTHEHSATEVQDTLTAWALRVQRPNHMRIPDHVRAELRQWVAGSPRRGRTGFVGQDSSAVDLLRMPFEQPTPARLAYQPYVDAADLQGHFELWPEGFDPDTPWD
jgi:excisionase family DNA binding protein